MIEERFDVAYIAAHALREKQVQQNYRPIIAVHKWFARRPGTLFRGLTLAEFCDQPLRSVFTRSNQLKGITIADPFMGGGSPLIEANRLGADVLGFDINPMAYWIVRQELEHLDLDAYREAADRLVESLSRELGHLYTTRCECGEEVPVKYFLWVKQHRCSACAETFDLWPGYLMAKDTRHVAHVIICWVCGELNERTSLQDPGACRTCDKELALEGNARRSRATCASCGHVDRYPNGESPPRHRLYALEYHCAACRPKHRGRFFKRADENDLKKANEAISRLGSMRGRFIPDDEIPEGDETNRLHRWGYRRYRELFNERQLVGLELAARFIEKIPDRRVRSALATNLSDLLRYQNLLCRYDTMALKSLDIFSVHGFPVSLVQCESNMLGIMNSNGTPVGSGGWVNIVTKFDKAKAFCDRPFETLRRGGRKELIYTDGEWIGDRRGNVIEREIDIRTEDASTVELEPMSLDAVFTDPPYFGMIQYAELMDFCYVWLRRLVGREVEAFRPASTRHENELTGNHTNGRSLEHFAEGLSRAYQTIAKALKELRPLAFTFHHNQLSAYGAIGVAILDSGLTCTATLPCPAEMGGSIHISNTSSSILDSVFVCRKGAEAPEQVGSSFEQLVDALNRDAIALAEAGYKCTSGDLSCLLNGHICRLTVNHLSKVWDSSRPISEKLESFQEEADRLAQTKEIISAMRDIEPIPVDLNPQRSLFETGALG